MLGLRVGFQEVSERQGLGCKAVQGWQNTSQTSSGLVVSRTSQAHTPPEQCRGPPPSTATPEKFWFWESLAPKFEQNPKPSIPQTLELEADMNYSIATALETKRLSSNTETNDMVTMFCFFKVLTVI